MAAEFGALSADHLEHADEPTIQSMARAGMVAVLLPGAFYALSETKKPPVGSSQALESRWRWRRTAIPAPRPSSRRP
jgi:imidazolonepropionase-like amidohydrolase